MLAVEIQRNVKRSRGRPQSRSDQATRQLIIEAAAIAFQAKGYGATSMGEVAQRAEVSTRTMYRLIPTKAALFSAVVTDRIRGFTLGIDDAALSQLGLTAALERILIDFGTLMLNEKTIAICRLVIGECERFPEIAVAFYQAAIQPVSDAIERWLRYQCERGLIQLLDPSAAASALRGMMIMDPQGATMLGQRVVIGTTEIAERARLCAQIFLNGCRV